MEDAAALSAALVLARKPAAIRAHRKAPLPAGMTFLLEIAAGEARSIELAFRSTGQTEAVLQSAAEFFIEQVLLHRSSDSYRVLGCNPDASSSVLRRNMALLMKILHPDVAPNGTGDVRIDRSVFAHRVAQAWEDLKTDDRRSAYDLARRQLSSDRHNGPARVNPSDGADPGRHGQVRWPRLFGQIFRCDEWRLCRG
jgi:hypothetical protein